MAENGGEGGAPAEANEQAQAQQVRMQVLGQYIRDLSFENVMAQKGVTGEVKPEVQVQVNLDGKKRTVENQYEVMIKLKISSKAKGTDAQLFLMELDYGGLFQIEGVPENQLHAFLLIECPRMLFPFVRRIVSDVSRDGGFPPLNLENIDFLQLYRNEMAKRAQAPKPAQA